MLVISNMMPPTASRERAGKSRLEIATENWEIITFNNVTPDSPSRFSKNQWNQEDVCHLEQQTPTSKLLWCTAICWRKEYYFQLRHPKNKCEMGQKAMNKINWEDTTANERTSLCLPSLPPNISTCGFLHSLASCFPCTLPDWRHMDDIKTACFWGLGWTWENGVGWPVCYSIINIISH